MITKQWFRYEAGEGHVYDFGAYYTVRRSRPALLSVDMYNLDGEYVGNWRRENMPIGTIFEIERWIKGDPSFSAFQLSQQRGR